MPLTANKRIIMSQNSSNHVNIPAKKDRISRLPLELKFKIISDLSFAAKANLSSCSQSWHNITNPELYKQHSDETIERIVLYSEDGKRGCNALDLAVRYGNDVNAQITYPNGFTTALHVAAALDKTRMVRHLLSLGANISAESVGMHQWPALSMDVCAEDLITMQTDVWFGNGDSFRWLPLLIPMLRKYYKTAVLLLRNQAPPCLWKPEDTDTPEEERMLTVLHMMASYPDLWTNRDKLTKKERQAVEEERAKVPKELQPSYLIRTFPHVINAQHPTSGDTALCMALRYEHASLTNFLLRHEADVNLATFHGTVPIYIATDKACLSKETRSINWYIEQLQQLLSVGANAATFNVRSDLSTPIMVAISSAMLEWKGRGVIMNVRRVVRTLVDAGALVNASSPRAGYTAVQILVLEIIKMDANKIPPDAKALLEEMINHYQANINTVTHDGHSVLWIVLRAVESYKGRWRTRDLADLLIQLGARLQPMEADWVFMQKIYRGYQLDERIILEQRHNVRQRHIDAAYAHVYGKPRFKSTHEWLKLHFPIMTNGSAILARWIQYQGAKLGEEQLLLPFDPNYVDNNQRSFLHMMVTRLIEDTDEDNQERRTRVRLTEKQIIKDAQKLINRSMSVCIKDRMGKTALHRLRMANRPYQDLEYLLMRQRDIERDQFFDDGLDQQLQEDDDTEQTFSSLEI